MPRQRKKSPLGKLREVKVRKLKVPPKECGCGGMYVPTKKSKDMCLFCFNGKRQYSREVLVRVSFA